MAVHYFAVTGTGAADGSSRADAQTASVTNMNTAAATVGDGGTLYFETGTYTFSADQAFRKGVIYESIEPLGAVFDQGTTTVSILYLGATSNTAATTIKNISLVNYRAYNQAPTGFTSVLDGVKMEWDTASDVTYGFINTQGKELNVRNSILIPNFSNNDPLFDGSGTSFSLTNSSIFVKASAVGANGIIVNAANIPATLKNCIFVSDTSSAIGASLASSATNCCFQNFGSNNTSGGTNNVFADPQFVDAANGDYRLRPSSPCINAGTAS